MLILMIIIDANDFLDEDTMEKDTLFNDSAFSKNREMNEFAILM
jgi:hypothetical protein